MAEAWVHWRCTGTVHLWRSSGCKALPPQAPAAVLLAHWGPLPLTPWAQVGEEVAREVLEEVQERLRRKDKKKSKKVGWLGLGLAGLGLGLAAGGWGLGLGAGGWGWGLGPGTRAACG
jgi:hypothetical protein